MTRPKKSVGNRSNLPGIALTVAVALTLLLLVANSVLLWKMQQDFSDIAEVEFELQRLRATILHLDETLTMSCQLSAATGDQRWERRYRKHEPLLERAIRRAIQLTPESYRVDATTQTDAANTKLVRIENQAFDLVKRGKLDGASALLMDAEYQEQKQIYSQGMERFAAGIDKRIADGVGRYRVYLVFAASFAVLGSVVLAATWYTTLRIVYRDEARRQKAEQALNTAHTQLESRVQDRTKELQDSDQRFRATFEQAAVGIAQVAPDGKFLRVNQKLCDIWGYHREELLNCTFQDITHPDDLDEDLANVQRLLAGEIETYSMDKRYVCKDRSVAWGHLTVALVRDETDQPKYFVSVVEDISVRKRAEEALRQSEARFDSAARGSHDGLWDWDIISGAEWWSPRFYELLGFEDGEIEANYAAFKDLLHPDEKQRTLDAIKDHLENQVPYDVEYRLRTKAGTYRWFSGRGQAIWNDVGAPVRMAGSIRDVTDRILAEEALQLRAHDLEVANRDLQEFAHITSHDLREPLRAVSGFCSLLQKKYQALLDEDGKEYVQHVVDGASRMSDLLDGLLAYSRVGTHGASFQQVDCNEVLETVLANLHAAINETHAKVEHDNLPRMRCDKTQLIQLFQNLIANAIKYRGARNPQIHISAAKDGNSWQFSVQDNGIGFDTSQSDRIYDIFVRLHSRDEYAGMGLGLAICKRIVQRHGGRIWAESEPGCGSTFYFTIPEAGEGDQQ